MVRRMQPKNPTANLNFIKYLSLITLVLQTTGVVLVKRYSRIVPTDKRYLPTTAVVCAEVIKLLTCLCLVLFQSGFRLNLFVGELKKEIIDEPFENFKLLLPAFLFTIQSNLLYIALSNLDAATYQVTYQLKIFVTAIFCVTMLGKKLSTLKWVSLFILVLGIFFVQWPAHQATDDHSNKNQVVGLVAVLSACFSSGFASVYFEKILKGSTTSLWVRNIQLGFFGALFGICGVGLNDLNSVLTDGFFQGYNYIVWCVILLQALGGLIIAAVIKYADNILKGFANALSIILSSILSYYLLQDFVPTGLFAIGGFLVIAATFLYGYEKSDDKSGNLKDILIPKTPLVAQA